MSVSTLTLFSTDIVATQTVYAANELARFDAIEDWATDVKSICGTSLQTTGNQTVTAGVKTFAVSPIVPTPTTDKQAAPKDYVDDQITESAGSTYSGGESHTFAGGLIIKGGVKSCAGSSDTTVTFGDAFSTGVLTASATPDRGAGNTGAYVNTFGITKLKIYNTHTSTVNIRWIAIGY